MARERGMTNDLRRGFSLLEISLVVLLIGILLGVVAYSMPGWLERTRIRATRASLNVIKNSLTAYNGMYASYPAALSALQQGSPPFLEPSVKLQDGWNNAFMYQTPGNSGRAFELMSKGPNGAFDGGGGDDLDVWKAE